MGWVDCKMRTMITIEVTGTSITASRECYITITNMMNTVVWEDLNVVAFDGLTASDQNEWMPVFLKLLEMTNFLMIFLISSMGFPVLRSAVATTNNTFKVPPWTFSDYVKACENEPFFRSVLTALGGRHDRLPYSEAQKRGLLERKFAIAGHCCRWMFSLPAASVFNEVAVHLSRVPSYDDLLAGMGGERSKFAVNHLIVTFGKDDKGIALGEVDAGETVIVYVRSGRSMHCEQVYGEAH